MVLLLQGHQSAPSKHPNPRDPGLPGERPGGEGPEETLQPGAEESAAGRVPQGESCRKFLIELVGIDYCVRTTNQAFCLQS